MDDAVTPSFMDFQSFVCGGWEREGRAAPDLGEGRLRGVIRVRYGLMNVLEVALSLL